MPVGTGIPLRVLKLPLPSGAMDLRVFNSERELYGPSVFLKTWRRWSAPPNPRNGSGKSLILHTEELGLAGYNERDRVYGEESPWPYQRPMSIWNYPPI